MDRILQSYRSALRNCHSRSQVASLLDTAAYDPALSISGFYSVCGYAVNVFCDSFIFDDLYDDIFYKEV